MENEILIRINAIDEATKVITRISDSLKSLSTTSMPSMNLGKGSIWNVSVIKKELEGAFAASERLNSSAVKSFQSRMNQMPVEPVERLSQSLQIAGVTQKQFTNFLAQNNLEVIKGVGVYDRLSGAILTQGQAVKLASIQARRFKFEWLSVMFAGMALDRALSGIINAQMQLFGVTDAMSSMWTVTMLPAMALITPAIHDMIGEIMNLPESVQMVIGLSILGLDGLAKILNLMGQSALAYMGFSQVAKDFGLKLGELAIIIGKISVVLFGTALVLYGLYKVVKYFGENFNEVFKGVGIAIMGVGFILLAFVGWWALIPIAVGAAVWAIAKYWDKLPGYIQKPLIAIYVFLEALAKNIYAVLINPFIAFVKMVYYAMRGDFASAWDVAADAMYAVIDPFIDMGKRYEELSRRSDEYTAKQKAGMNGISNATKITADSIQQSMGKSLEDIGKSFTTTDVIGTNVSNDLQSNWNISSTNMANSTIESVNNINKTLSSIPSQIETVHVTREITIYGGGSAPSGGTTPRSEAPKIFTPIPIGDILKNIMRVRDAIITPSGLVYTDPGDYLIATKNPGSLMGSKGSITVSPTYNIYVQDKYEIEKLINANNYKLVEEVKRQINI